MKSMPPLAWRSNCGKYQVRVTKRAYYSMHELAAQYAPCEVGTSLVGSYSDDGCCAIVHGIAPLSADSKGSPNVFHRGILGLRSFFNRITMRFRGRRHYVGEWHSHPGSDPSASLLDDRNQAAISSDEKVDCPESILVIIGGNLSTNPSLGLFVYSRNGGKITLHS